MKIEDGCLVSLRVRMFDAQGNLLEATEAPLVYLHGANDVFPRIEEALAGQEPGAKTSITLEPHESFGDFDAEQVHVIDVSELGEAASAGMQYEGLPGNADGRTYTVTDVAQGLAVLDGNHPLAGRTLRFDIEVLSVERASAEDLAAAEAPRTPDLLRVVAPHDVHGADDEHRH